MLRHRIDPISHLPDRHRRSVLSKTGGRLSGLLSQIGHVISAPRKVRAKAGVRVCVAARNGPSGSSPQVTFQSDRAERGAQGSVRTCLRCAFGHRCKNQRDLPAKATQAQARGQSAASARLALSAAARGRVTACVHVNGDHGTGRFDYMRPLGQLDQCAHARRSDRARRDLKCAVSRSRHPRPRPLTPCQLGRRLRSELRGSPSASARTACARSRMAVISSHDLFGSAPSQDERRIRPCHRRWTSVRRCELSRSVLVLDLRARCSVRACRGHNREAAFEQHAVGDGTALPSSA